MEGEVLDLKGQLAEMEEIKTDMEGHIADLSQELAASRKAAEKQAAERTAALQVWIQGVQVVLLCMQQLGTLGERHKHIPCRRWHICVCISVFKTQITIELQYSRCAPRGDEPKCWDLH